MDTKQKLLEIAAMDLGGAAEDYELKGESVVVSKADASKSMSFGDCGDSGRWSWAASIPARKCPEDHQ